MGGRGSQKEGARPSEPRVLGSCSRVKGSHPSPTLASAPVQSTPVRPGVSPEFRDLKRRHGRAGGTNLAQWEVDRQPTPSGGGREGLKRFEPRPVRGRRQRGGVDGGTEASRVAPEGTTPEVAAPERQHRRGTKGEKGGKWVSQCRIGGVRKKVLVSTTSLEVPGGTHTHVSP